MPAAAAEVIREIQAAAATDEEPILANLRLLWRQAEGRYRNNPMHPYFKIGLAGLLLTGTVLSMEVWLPMLLSTAMLYLIYRAVRSVVVQPGNVAVKPPVSRRPPVPPEDEAMQVTQPMAAAKLAAAAAQESAAVETPPACVAEAHVTAVGRQARTREVHRVVWFDAHDRGDCLDSGLAGQLYCRRPV